MYFPNQTAKTILKNHYKQRPNLILYHMYKYNFTICGWQHNEMGKDSIKVTHQSFTLNFDLINNHLVPQCNALKNRTKNQVHCYSHYPHSNLINFTKKHIRLTLFQLNAQKSSLQSSNRWVWEWVLLGLIYLSLSTNTSTCETVWDSL